MLDRLKGRGQKKGSLWSFRLKNGHRTNNFTIETKVSRNLKIDRLLKWPRDGYKSNILLLEIKYTGLNRIHELITSDARMICNTNIKIQILTQVQMPLDYQWVDYPDMLISCDIPSRDINLLSRVSAVSIATGYGQDDWVVRVRVPVGSRIFTYPCCKVQLWGPTSLLSNGYWGLIPWG
jgi:hypothetical protein